MGIFNLGKRKQTELPLPPPPQPPQLQPLLRGDIEPIRAPQEEKTPEETPIQNIPQPPELPEIKRFIIKKPEPPTIPEIQDAPIPPIIQDKTIAEQIQEPPKQLLPKQAFVSIDDYKRIINDTNTIRTKLMEAEQFVKRLSEIKNEEERAFEKWRAQLEDVEKKINYVDQLIAQAQR